VNRREPSSLRVTLRRQIYDLPLYRQLRVERLRSLQNLQAQAGRCKGQRGVKIMAKLSEKAWEEIYTLWRSGTATSLLANTYFIKRQTIDDRAKRYGWARDLARGVRARAH
jgi:hypothetical protein